MDVESPVCLGSLRDGEGRALRPRRGRRGRVGGRRAVVRLGVRQQRMRGWQHILPVRPSRLVWTRQACTRPRPPRHLSAKNQISGIALVRGAGATMLPLCKPFGKRAPATIQHGLHRPERVCCLHARSNCATRLSTSSYSGRATCRCDRCGSSSSSSGSSSSRRHSSSTGGISTTPTDFSRVIDGQTVYYDSA